MVDIVYASSGTAASGGMGSTLIMIVLMIAIFYFLLIRPENKRKKQAEEMRSSLKKGDWLTTIGGVYGRVVSVTDRTVVIETSEDRVRLEFVKSAVGAVGTLGRCRCRSPQEQEGCAQEGRGRRRARYPRQAGGACRRGEVRRGIIFPE